jgi:tRNA(His) guanylyltransferase
MTKDSLGDRMVGYQDVSRPFLTKRLPVIIRVDGKAFHTFTRKYWGKGYTEQFIRIMADAVQATAAEMQGCTLAYTQSDEASFLLTDYKTIQTQGWFEYNLNKLVSVSASLMTAWFNFKADFAMSEPVMFDSRAFTLPQDEVCNYFIWRQQDATRNAIQMAGQEHFSQKQLHGKSCNEIQEMLFQEKQINFNDYPTDRRRGVCIVNGVVDNNIPVFTQDRNFIEKHVYIRED